MNTTLRNSSNYRKQEYVPFSKELIDNLSYRKVEVTPFSPVYKRINIPFNRNVTLPDRDTFYGPVRSKYERLGY